jgi:hypothetical protein
VSESTFCWHDVSTRGAEAAHNISASSVDGLKRRKNKFRPAVMRDQGSGGFTLGDVRPGDLAVTD